MNELRNGPKLVASSGPKLVVWTAVPRRVCSGRYQPHTQASQAGSAPWLGHPDLAGRGPLGTFQGLPLCGCEVRKGLDKDTDSSSLKTTALKNLKSFIVIAKMCVCVCVSVYSICVCMCVYIVYVYV